MARRPIEMELPQTPSFRLDGKRALVSGAGRGIGLALAAALAGAGAHVTLTARTASEIEEAAAALRARGKSADAVALDVNETAAFAGMLAGRPAYDVFVNNAGTNRPKSFTEVTEDDYDAVMGLNLRAAFFAAQSVTKGMIAAGIFGSIIHVSSQMGHVGGPSRTLYCASKWGMEGMSRAMAIDLAPHRIRSNTLCPTFTETPLTKPFLADPEFRAFVLGKIKLGRLGKVEDLMGAAVYLASDASSLMTGASMIIDGGWTAG
jgi:NAD(P)-dependent dehydrogenase (short-subunit alcohol dehydrogenase family)